MVIIEIIYVFKNLSNKIKYISNELKWFMYTFLLEGKKQLNKKWYVSNLSNRYRT